MNEKNDKEMSLKRLSDQDLLFHTKRLVENERKLLTEILHHLREVEKRKLFSDLGYKSLFEYAVKELRYSEGQAGRRIQAMRLIKEIPEVEEKIKAGSLSLSNVSQAQSYFREMKKIKKESLFFQEKVNEECRKPQLSSQTKLEVLKRLENKSSREGEKVLLSLQEEKPLPKEKERLVSETHTEVRFVMSEELKKKLEEVRSLLGPKGAMMNFSELVEFMAGISAEQLKVKKFGKKRTVNELQNPTPAPELQCSTDVRDLGRKSKNQRYISASLKHHIWMRDQGKCQNCGSKRNIQWDHIKPMALGGKTTKENLRLLCFHCNQRHAMKKMGVGFIQNFWK